ncbi:MAG: hypothetical protein ACE5GK_04225 [Nitrospiria bacterium]
MAWSYLFIGIPLLGATVGLLIRSNPKMTMGWFLCVTSLQCLLLLLFPSPSFNPITAPMLLIVAFSTWLVTLSHRIQSTPPSELFEVLFLCGLGFGFLLHPGRLGLIYLMGIFALLIRIQFRGESLSRADRTWLMGLYGLGILALLAALLFDGTYRPIALFSTYMLLLPLFPFHGMYFILLQKLPGTLSAFLALFLPVLGLSGLLPILADLPFSIDFMLRGCAVLGVLSGAVRSLVQNRIPARLSQIALVFWSILWWYILGAEGEMLPAVVFLCAAGLTLCGLWLSWQGLKFRHGDLCVDQFGGLASAMPRFSVLFSLLIAAAMGLPFFGVFSGFVEMVFSHSKNFSLGLIPILLAWFFASLTLPSLMEKTLFGPIKPNWIYRDFEGREIFALTFVVIVLIGIGIAPYRLFGLGNLPELANPLSDLVLWKK